MVGGHISRLKHCFYLNFEIVNFQIYDGDVHHLLFQRSKDIIHKTVLRLTVWSLKGHGMYINSKTKVSMLI